jgi:hypothetical protein
MLDGFVGRMGRGGLIMSGRPPPADLVGSLRQGVGARHIIDAGEPGFAATDTTHAPAGRTKGCRSDVVGSSTIRTNDIHGRFASFDGEKLTAVC